MPKTRSARRARAEITVLLVDDHAVVRDGVRCILEHQPDIRVISAVGDGSTAAREAGRLKPKVVLMDISMPGLDGIEATRIIARKNPEVSVLMLSMHSAPAVVRRAMEAGARGYVPKDAVVDEVVHAVRTVADGGRYIAPTLARDLLEGGEVAQVVDAAVESLTATERSILKLVAEGKSSSEIAAAIALSPRTVETYRLHLMRKLGVDNLPALVRYAIRQGIVPLE